MRMRILPNCRRPGPSRSVKKLIVCRPDDRGRYRYRGNVHRPCRFRRRQGSIRRGRKASRRLLNSPRASSTASASRYRGRRHRRTDHGATTVLSTLIERKGAKTGLIVTRGTRDVYIIGRGNRPEAYNLFLHRHDPPLPRHLTREIDERIIGSGDAFRPEQGDVTEAVNTRRRRRRGRRGLPAPRLR